MSKGYLSLVLHAHLPFVRHPEYQRFLEENWLFEAISETYLPLLRIFHSLYEDNVPYRVTVSISPTLAAMLTDEVLQNRYLAHLEKLIELSIKELVRTRDDREFQPIVRIYKELYEQNLSDFTGLYKKNILKGFKDLEKAGVLDIITTTATHAFLPVFEEFPQAIEAQIQTAIISHGRTFGKAPKGMWIPELGFFPGMDKFFKHNGIKYCFSAPHAILFSEQETPYGVYAPVKTSNGLYVFGRDVPSSRSVWSAEEGYPGDFVYRDFYRDIGFDLPIDYIRPYIHDDDIRICTGFKYYAITGKTDHKKPYSYEDAMTKVRDHAKNFIYQRSNQVKKLAKIMDRPPLVVSPFDAELFGHWWFEGPMWLDCLIRSIAGTDIELITPEDYLALYPDNPSVDPTFSSWGNNGYGEVWIDHSNDWIYRHVHRAVDRMNELVERYPRESGLKRRVLNQAAREVLLSQSSDWPFIMKTGTTVPYAVKRIKEHLFNFTKIYNDLCRNTIDTEWLTTVERKNNIFPDMDYRVFGKTN